MIIAIIIDSDCTIYDKIIIIIIMVLVSYMYLNMINLVSKSSNNILFDLSKDDIIQQDEAYVTL